MKVSLIGPVYPYRGGISHFTSMLCKSLIDHQHSVSLISFTRQYPSWLYPGKTDRDPSQDLFKLETEYLLDPIDIRTWNRTFQRVMDFQPDIVILPWWTTFWAPADAYLSHKFRRNGIPITFLIHNVLPHEQKPWDRILAKTALIQANNFIVQTEHEANRLKELIPGANYAICSHPLYSMFSDTKLTKIDAKNLLGIPPTQKALLFFGIVRPYKGLDTLIQALVHLHTKDIMPFLIIAGEFWQDKSSLWNLIDDANIAEQILIDDQYIVDQDIPKYFSAADIFVAPYRKGTQSGAVKLALGFHLPVVLSQTIADAAILEMDNYPVYITPPDDPAELANALEIALQDLEDSSRVSSRLEDDGWGELVKVIEDMVIEFDHPDDQ